MSFLEHVHDLICKFLIFSLILSFNNLTSHVTASEAESMYNDLFVDTSLEVGKALSKNEREQKDLNEEKVRCPYFHLSDVDVSFGHL
jgi:hypothetical protein